jgi:ribokinase
MKQAVITIVGSVNMDLVFRTPRMPDPGETIQGHQFLQIPGGKGGNQAVACARAGGQVRLIARVGDDALGAQLLASLQTDGVDTTQVVRLPGMATGVAGILVDDSGQNSIVLASGANAALNEADIDAAAALITNAQFLVCQLETPLAGVERAIALAHQAGVAVIFNPTPIQPLSDTMLAQVKYLVLNEIEAGQLSGLAVHDLASARQAAQLLLDRGAECVLLTLGAQGVWLAQAEQTQPAQTAAQLLPAFEVAVVDTTAAGDTFVGNLALALAEQAQAGVGVDVVAACRRAQAAAALSVTKIGAQSSIPTRLETEAFLQQH